MKKIIITFVDRNFHHGRCFQAFATVSESSSAEQGCNGSGITLSPLSFLKGGAPGYLAVSLLDTRAM